MLKKLIKFPILKRIIPSILIRILKITNKNRGYFKIREIDMYLDFLDPIDREIILNKNYEPDEFNYLNSLFEKHNVNVFVDIGANCGYYLFALSNKQAHLIGFEPNKEAVLKIEKTFEKNDALKKKIDIYNFGLSNQNSSLKMKSLVKFGYIQTGGSQITNQNMVNENEITYNADFKVGDEVLNFSNKIMVFKIDVEGHEKSVLQGLIKNLSRNKCIIFIEIWGKNFNDINSYLLNNNYKLIQKFPKRSNYFYSNFD